MKRSVNWLEVTVPAGLAMAGSAIFFTAISFPTNAMIFPVGLSVLLVALCLFKLGTTFGDPKIETDFPLSGVHLKRFLQLIACMAAFYVALKWLGMYPTMLIFFLSLFRLLGGLRAGRNVILSIVLTVALFGVFDTLLGLPAPAGLLGFLKS